MRDSSWPNAVLLDVTSPSNATPLTFSRTLAAGSSYKVELSGGCEQPNSSRTWTVEQPSAVPSSLPALRVLGRGTGYQIMTVYTGECSRDLPVGYVAVQVDLSALSPGYRNVLRDVMLVVDGTPRSEGPPPYDPYRQASEPAPAIETTRTLRLTTQCLYEWEPAAGKHTVLVRATVPTAAPYVIETPAIEVHLPCPELSDADAGLSAQADAGAASDAGGDAAASALGADAGETMGATVGAHDSVPPVDAAQVAQETDTAAPPESNDGCNAGSGRRSNAASLLLFVGLCLLFAGTGRRRNPGSRR